MSRRFSASLGGSIFGCSPPVLLISGYCSFVQKGARGGFRREALIVASTPSFSEASSLFTISALEMAPDAATHTLTTISGPGDRAAVAGRSEPGAAAQPPAVMASVAASGRRCGSFMVAPAYPDAGSGVSKFCRGGLCRFATYLPWWPHRDHRSALSTRQAPPPLDRRRGVPDGIARHHDSQHRG